MEKRFVFLAAANGVYVCRLHLPPQYSKINNSIPEGNLKKL
jgi:hypothetical protein